MDPIVITQTLRDEIETGVLMPGHVLKQEELAERFGVSRQPIRHVLEGLRALGLLEKRADRSLAVTHLQAKDVRALCQIRISLETTALKLSAPHLTPSALRKAKRLNEDLYEEEHPEVLAKLDWDFHHILYGACGNERLLTMISDLRGEAKRAYSLQPKGSRPRSAFYDEHQKILDALHDNDITTAIEILALHIGVTAGTLTAINQT